MKKNIFMIMLISLISKFFGFGKQMVLAFFFGATNISDAYSIAITIPNVIFGFIGATLIAGFIPRYNSIKEHNSQKQADDFTSNLANILFVIITILIILIFIFSNSFVKIFASGFDVKTAKIASDFTRISIFSLYSIYIATIYTGYLQNKNFFIIPAVIEIPVSILMIIAVVFASKINIYILPFGFFVVMSLKGIFLFLYAGRKGYKHTLKFNIKDDNITSLVYIALPMIMGISVNQINILVDKTIASRISVGGISALDYSSSLNSIIQGIFVLSVITVTYPTFSKMVTEGNDYGFKRILNNSINSINILVIPAAFGFFLFSEEIVSLLFARGSFGPDAIFMTSQALLFYSLGLIGIGLRDIISRAFYALNDIKTPMKNAVYGLIVNIILNIILSRVLGIGGIALATSIAATFTTILLFISLRKKIGPFGMKQISITLLKILFASLLMGITAKLSFSYLATTLSQNLSLVIAICIGIISYLLIMSFMKIKDVNVIVGSIKKKIGL